MRWTLDQPIPAAEWGEWATRLLDESTDVGTQKAEPVLVYVTYSGADTGVIESRGYVFLTDDLPVTSSSKETLLPRFGSPARLSSTSKHAVDLSWLVEPDQAKAAAPEKLRLLYRGIQQWLRSSDYHMVDALFRAADVAHLPVETLTALLRYSFAARQKLPYWQTLLAQVRQELEKRKMDTAALLYGLEEDRAQQASG
jgi:hypothetical protein